MSQVRPLREEYANDYRQSQGHVPHGRLYQPIMRGTSMRGPPRLLPHFSVDE